MTAPTPEHRGQADRVLAVELDQRAVLPCSARTMSRGSTRLLERETSRIVPSAMVVASVKAP